MIFGLTIQCIIVLLAGGKSEFINPKIYFSNFVIS